MLLWSTKGEDLTRTESMPIGHQSKPSTPAPASPYTFPLVNKIQNFSQKRGKNTLLKDAYIKKIPYLMLNYSGVGALTHSPVQLFCHFILPLLNRYIALLHQSTENQTSCPTTMSLCCPLVCKIDYNIPTPGVSTYTQYGVINLLLCKSFPLSFAG